MKLLGFKQKQNKIVLTCQEVSKEDIFVSDTIIARMAVTWVTKCFFSDCNMVSSPAMSCLQVTCWVGTQIDKCFYYAAYFIDKKTGWQTHKHTYRHTDRQTDIETYRTNRPRADSLKTATIFFWPKNSMIIIAIFL